MTSAPPTGLSIVIPVFNAAHTLGAQIESLVESMTDEMELLVVDNRSTDDSRAVALRFAEASPNIRVITAADRQGEPHARNVGVAAARSECIAFCDADDVVAATWAPAMLAALQRSEYVTGPVELDRLNPDWLADFRGRRMFAQLPVTAAGIPFAHGCSFGVRRSVVERVGGFAEDVLIGCDVDFAIRAYHAGVRLEWADDAVVHYRHRSSSKQRWRQAMAFGRAAHHLHELAGERDGFIIRCRRQLRRVGWLVLTTPKLGRSGHRARWLWTLALVLGEIRGARS